MRYLYGDSVPFPPQHDFLAALETGLDRAVTAAALEAEALHALRSAEEGVVGHVRLLTELEQLHASFVASARHAGVANMAKEVGSSPVQQYAARMGDEAERVYLEIRRATEGAIERDRSEAAAVANQRRAQVRGAIESLLIAVRLPVVESRISMNLEIDGCSLTTRLVHPDGLVTSFALGTERAPEWQKPRKVSDIANNVTLPVGIKRSLFKRTVQHEPLLLDELIIGGFDISDEGCELRLRKKANQKDMMVLNLRQTEAGAFAEVHHLEAGAEGLPTSLEPEDAAQLERFWTLLRSSTGVVQGYRTRLLSATLEGRDVFEQHATTAVVAIVVKMLAPIAQEVVRRSPNPNELSLKLEGEGGRREEIYLKKSVLAQKLANVPSSEKHVFDALVFLQG